MKLGILARTGSHRKYLRDIALAASAEGHEVDVFLMDEAAALLGDPLIAALASTARISMVCCTLSLKRAGFDVTDVPSEISCGSQYDNAMMFESSDRVIVL